MIDDKQEVFEILKYGPIHPNKVKKLISTYFESDCRWNDDWSIVKTEIREYEIDCFVFNTHYLNITVHFSPIENKTILAIFDRDGEYGEVVPISDYKNKELPIVIRELIEKIEKRAIAKEYYNNFTE